LEEGKNIALVSDAGTPGISDPGYSLVSEVRKYFATTPGGRENSRPPGVVSIPGPSALTSFVSVLGVGTHAWTFYGFLPHKNGRQKLLKEMLSSEYSSIFYESTHRIEKALKEILELSKNKSSFEGGRDAVREDVKVAIGKELTKIHESIMIGTPEEILEIFRKDKQKTKGEFVVMII
jgi:16S rRNA (cytidine1402-2'-O)-methyltransferase